MPSTVVRICASTGILPSTSSIPAASPRARRAARSRARGGWRRGRSTGPRPRHAAVASSRSSAAATPVRRSTPSSPSHDAMTSPTSAPRRSICGNSSAVARITSAPFIARDAATSHPMNPEPTTRTRPRAARAIRSESARLRSVMTPASAGIGTGGVAGRAPVASTQLSYAIGSPPAASTVRPSASSDSTRHPVSELDVLLAVEVDRSHRQPGGVHLAPQVLLAERGALVGGVRVGGQQRYPPGSAVLTVGLGRRKAGGAAADDDDVATRPAHERSQRPRR